MSYQPPTTTIGLGAGTDSPADITISLYKQIVEAASGGSVTIAQLGNTKVELLRQWLVAIT